MSAEPLITADEIDFGDAAPSVTDVLAVVERIAAGDDRASQAAAASKELFPGLRALSPADRDVVIGAIREKLRGILSVRTAREDLARHDRVVRQLGREVDGLSATKTPSQATILVHMARQAYDLGVATDGEPFAIAKRGPRIARLFRGSRHGLRTELAAEYFDRAETAPSSSALTDALATIEGHARREDPVELHLRVARDEDAVWVDLGRPDGTCVRVDGSGWQLSAEPEPLFVRTVLQKPLPLPSASGSIELLRDLLGLDDDLWSLALGWLIGSFLPNMPRPVLLMLGEQGSAKTTRTRMLASMVDPAEPQTRSAPREERDWITAAASSALVAVDNLSHLPGWLSDSLCRAVTGEGFVRRRLFTDADLAVTAYRRALILNAIELPGLRGDLLDRAVVLQLPRIAETDRTTEGHLWARFERARPAIFSAILDLLSAVLRNLPDVQVSAPPRMADYARVLASLDAATGMKTLPAYRANAGHSLAASVEGDHVAGAVAELLDRRGRWSGIASELLRDLDAQHRDGRPPRGWPSTPQHLANRLKRAAPSLRAAGIDVSDKFDDGGRRVWTLNGPSADENGVHDVGMAEDAVFEEVVL